jgi:sporulation protein YlmC with PRC-barrel domain
MTRQLLAATAAIALMSGVALAQNAPATDQPMKPPVTTDQSSATTTPEAGGTNTNSTAETKMPDAAPGAAADMGNPDAAKAAMAPDAKAAGGDAGAKMPTDSASSTDTGAKMPTDSASSTDAGGGASDMNKTGSTDTAATPPAAETSTTTAATPPATDSSTTAAAPAAPSTTADTKSIAAGEPVSGDDLIGRKVVGSDDEKLGSVSDVVLDSKTGQIRQVVISSGGFLGIGAKTVALDFDSVTVEPEGGIKANSVTQKDIDSMPEFDVSSETKSLDEKVPEPAAGPTAPMGGAGMGAGSPAPASPAPAAQ